MLTDKIALITGGGRGIGRAIAFAFARAGASVALLARTESEIEQVAAELQQTYQVMTMCRACDVADAASVARAFADVADTFGEGINILVNNAGIAESAPFVQTDDELWQRHLAINLT